MRAFAIVLPMLLAACGSAKKAEPAAPVQSKPLAGAPSAGLVRPAKAQKPKPTVLPIPADKAQLKRLLTMGYKIHEDHLDPPGVASCPKMSENPVM